MRRDHDPGIDGSSDLNEFNHKLFVIDKESGPTSFDVVKAFRSTARVRKVGHAGTLDPLAEGVLLLITGRATRAAGYFVELRKTYRFDIRLGTATTTLDREGEIVARAPCPDFSREELESAAKQLTGSYEQMPPLFSAVKQNGTRLYRMARRGEEPDIKKRPVAIHRFDILEASMPFVSCEIECSRGTYVRSLARDFGAALSVPAHVSALVREAVGPFRRAGAASSGRIFAGNLEGIEGIPLDSALDFLPAVVINDRSARALLHGSAPAPEDVIEGGEQVSAGGVMRLLDESGMLLAVGRRNAGKAGGRASVVDSYRLFVDTTS